MLYSVFADDLQHEVTIDLPASKSLSNRALILKALCQEPCELSHLSDCDDTKVMLAAFAQEGKGFEEINIGAAGTSMRFLTAYFATKPGAEVILTGSERMKQRPIQLLVDALRQLGADIDYAGNEGFPPLRIRGRQLAGGALSIDGSTSSQYISALLMIAPTLANGLQLTLTHDITSRPYIEMTRQMMQTFGVESAWISDDTIEVKPQAYRAQAYAVESDWSAASYWYEIVALSKHADQRIHLLGLHKESLQGDHRIAEFFEPLGVRTEFTDEGVTLTKAENITMPQVLRLDMSEQPDLAQTVIATCCALNVGFDICGLHTLRIKETDRINALEAELLKMGFRITDENDDRMMFEPIETLSEDPEQLTPWSDVTTPLVKTYKDHRMAMAFAPMCLKLGSEEVLIDEPEVVSKSYPEFWKDLSLAGFSTKEYATAEDYVEQFAKVQKHHQKIRLISKIILNVFLLGFVAIIAWIIYLLV